jgi:NhaA family Na+:H+ antiporter
MHKIQPLSDRTQRIVGAIVIACALIAIVCSNIFTGYLDFWGSKTTVFHYSHKDIVNELIMCLFFCVAGIEIRHEFTDGNLNSKTQRRLPFFSALGGMIFPIVFMLMWAMIAHYFPLTEASPIFHALPVPVATDTVFALVVLSFFAGRIPPALRAFVLTFVVIDDIGGLIMLAILEGRISPTIVAVFVGFFVPEYVYKVSLRNFLFRQLTLVVSFFVLPLFALANAGVSFEGLTITSVLSAPLFWALISSQSCGKLLGVYGGTWLSVKKKWASLPTMCTMRHIFIAACAAGIGFTLSLYLVEAAFDEGDQMLIIAKVAVVCGTLLAAFFSWLAAKSSPVLTVKETHE